VALDMQRVGVSLTSHWRSTKVFSRLKAENGSSRESLPVAQKAKFPTFKVVNAGKSKDFGKLDFGSKPFTG
jgi:hypothetical protein